MTPLLAQIRRGERACERLYRRHARAVHRYALVLLRNPEEAERVTRTTFEQACRELDRGGPPRNTRAWLLGLAHAACRQRAPAREADLDADLRGADDCHPAQRAISLRVDGRLPRSERRALRSHLQECPECEGFAYSQRAQRSAWNALRVSPGPRTGRLASR
jgi:DNA-directed RNA polymerase specialized sigma24 family protein